jgi:hypothetical protein
LPSYGAGVLYGNGKDSVTIAMVIVATKKFQLPQKVSLWHLFRKLSSKAFKKHVTFPPFLVTKKIEFFFLVTTRYNDQFFSIPKPCGNQNIWSPTLQGPKEFAHHVITIENFSVTPLCGD